MNIIKKQYTIPGGLYEGHQEVTVITWCLTSTGEVTYCQDQLVDATGVWQQGEIYDATPEELRLAKEHGEEIYALRPGLNT